VTGVLPKDQVGSIPSILDRAVCGQPQIYFEVVKYLETRGSLLYGQWMYRVPSVARKVYADSRYVPLLAES